MSSASSPSDIAATSTGRTDPNSAAPRRDEEHSDALEARTDRCLSSATAPDRHRCRALRDRAPIGRDQAGFPPDSLDGREPGWLVELRVVSRPANLREQRPQRLEIGLCSDAPDEPRHVRSVDHEFGDDLIEFVETRLLAEYRHRGVPLIRMRPAIPALRAEFNTR
jgi:hypothetical protein